MEELDRVKLREIRETLASHLKEIEEKLGVTFSVGSISYGSTKASIKLDMQLLTTSGERAYSETDHMMADRAMAEKGIKLNGHVLGSTWKKAGRTLKVIGHNPRKPKYCMKIIVDGTTEANAPAAYFISAEQVLFEKPSFEDFKFWIDTDGDADHLTTRQVDLYDQINEWVANKVGDDLAESFFNLLSEVELDAKEKRQLHSFLCEGRIEKAIEIINI